MVVLYEQPAFLGLAPEGTGVLPGEVLRLRDGVAESLRAALVFEHLDPVEPMFDVVSLRDDHAGVPLARALQYAVCVGRQNVVERCALAVAAHALVGVGVEVLEHLVLLAGVLVLALVVEVLDARVRGLGEAEVELEHEVGVFPARDDVAAAALLGVLRRKREPRALGGDAVDGAHREAAVLYEPAACRKLLASLPLVLDAHPEVRRQVLAVEEQLVPLCLLLRRQLVGAERDGLHRGLRADAVHNAAVVPERLCERNLVDLEVLLVLDEAVAAEADVGKRLEDAGDVELAARALLREVLDRVDLDVLEVHLDDAVAVLADERGGVEPGAALVADVKADAEALVALADALQRRLRRRVEVGVVRPVVVHRRPEVVLDAVLLEKVHHLVRLELPFAGRAYLLALGVARDVGNLRVPLERDDRNVAHAVALRELARRRELGLGRVVERPEGHDLDAVPRALGLVSGDLGVGRVARNRAVYEAEVVAVDVLEYLERTVERDRVHRVARDAQLVRQVVLRAAAGASWALFTALCGLLGGLLGGGAPDGSRSCGHKYDLCNVHVVFLS